MMSFQSFAMLLLAFAGLLATLVSGIPVQARAEDDAHCREWPFCFTKTAETTVIITPIPAANEARSLEQNIHCDAEPLCFTKSKFNHHTPIITLAPASTTTAAADKERRVFPDNTAILPHYRPVSIVTAAASESQTLLGRPSHPLRPIHPTLPVRSELPHNGRPVLTPIPVPNERRSEDVFADNWSLLHHSHPASAPRPTYQGHHTLTIPTHHPLLPIRSTLNAVRDVEHIHPGPHTPSSYDEYRPTKLPKPTNRFPHLPYEERAEASTTAAQTTLTSKSLTIATLSFPASSPFHSTSSLAASSSSLSHPQSKSTLAPIQESKTTSHQESKTTHPSALHPHPPLAHHWLWARKTTTITTTSSGHTHTSTKTWFSHLPRPMKSTHTESHQTFKATSTYKAKFAAGPITWSGVSFFPALPTPHVSPTTSLTKRAERLRQLTRGTSSSITAATQAKCTTTFFQNPVFDTSPTSTVYAGTTNQASCVPCGGCELAVVNRDGHGPVVRHTTTITVAENKTLHVPECSRTDSLDLRRGCQSLSN